MNVVGRSSILLILVETKASMLASRYSGNRRMPTYCISIMLPLPPWLPPKKLVTLPPQRPNRLLLARS
jgi:hypothetical protein